MALECGARLGESRGCEAVSYDFTLTLVRVFT